MPRVQIKPGLMHRTPDGERRGGDIIDVTDAEVVSFGDKFTLLDDEERTAHQRIVDGVAEVMGVGYIEGVADAVATDGARELAAERGIPLADMTGTGKDGRIIKADVEAVLHE